MTDIFIYEISIPDLMGLLTEDIEVFNRLIEHSNNLDLIRSFYVKIGKPERVKAIFLSEAKKLARDFPESFQEAYEKEVFSPEVNKEELKKLAKIKKSTDLVRILEISDKPLFLDTSVE